jgi:hypothetical protein
MSDNNGNLIRDNHTGNGARTYDQENRLISATNFNNKQLVISVARYIMRPDDIGSPGAN